MSKDVEIFGLYVCGFENIQIEAISIRGHGPRMLKIRFSTFLNSKVEFKVFNIMASPRMLKSTIWMFEYSKKSKSKLLVSRKMGPGC